MGKGQLWQEALPNQTKRMRVRQEQLLEIRESGVWVVQVRKLGRICCFRVFLDHVWCTASLAAWEESLGVRSSNGT